MKQFIVKEQINLKHFTDDACAQASFRFHILLKEGRVKVNGKHVASDCALRAGDTVCYFLTPAEEARSAFAIVYEDANVIVADKADGVNSEAVYTALCERGECYFIHRLDRNTAGIMVFARTKEAERELLFLFRERRLRKVYLALAVGKMPKRHSIEEAFLQKDEKNATVRVTRAGGEKIVTEYEVLKEFEEVTLLRVTLHTGKTHQIRAHLAYLKHPVAGDMKYGDNAFNRAHNLTRQRLVAKELSLRSDGLLAYLSDRVFVSSYEVHL